MKFLFLDTETTGNDITQDRLCQLCYKTEDKTRTEYFKPPVPISIKSSSITHITNKAVADKPIFADSPMKQELTALLTSHILVAHNAKFDIAILMAEDLSVPRFICTLRLARHLDEEALVPEYNLQFLRYYFDLEVNGSAHDAEGDVLVTEALFHWQWGKFKERNLEDEEIVNQMLNISSQPSLIRKMPFGKYKDKKMEEIANLDRNYLDWLYRQKKEDGEQDEDWLYTLEYYLAWPKKRLL